MYNYHDYPLKLSKKLFTKVLATVTASLVVVGYAATYLVKSHWSVIM